MVLTSAKERAEIRTHERKKEEKRRDRVREKMDTDCAIACNSVVIAIECARVEFFYPKGHILDPNYIYDVWWFTSSFSLNIETIIEFQSSILHLPPLNYTALMILTFHRMSQLCPILNSNQSCVNHELK